MGLSITGTSPYANWLLNKEESLKVLKAAYDSGINTWDTSNVYSSGQSEEVIGAAIRELKIPRSKVVIMTKCAFAVGEDETVLGHGFPDLLLQSKDYVNQGGEFIV